MYLKILVVTLTAAQRTQEVGIRKVPGASTSNIVKVLTRDLLRLVVISLVIASLIAWFIKTSGYTQLVDLWYSGVIGFIHCCTNDEFPGYKSS